MAEDQDSLYKRKADNEWRDQVNERLVMLTQAVKSHDDDIDELGIEIHDLKEVLHGDARGRDGGLIEQANRNETRINEIYALIHGDIHGHGGLLNKVGDLADFKEDKRQDKKYRWLFYIALIPLIGTLATLSVEHWDSIKAWIPHEEGITKAVKRSHPRPRRPTPIQLEPENP